MSDSFDSPPETTPATRALDELGVTYRLVRHPTPPRTLEEAAAFRGQRPEQVVRSLLFRLEGDNYVMVLVAGPAQVSWPRLRAHLGRSRLTTATQEQVLAITGYPPGGVTPFGLPQRLRLLVDESVLAQEELSLGGGARGLALLLSLPDLLRALGDHEVGRFSG